MKRGEFLRSLGLNSAALMAFYCMGTSLTACSKSTTDPAPTTPASGLSGNADTSAGAINFTVDLTNSNYNSLKTVGSFLKVGSVLIANTTGNKYVTIQRLCTHPGFNFDQVSYTLSTNTFNCSGHGSAFNVDGTVKNGPTTVATKLYTTTISADGNTLTVKA
ncbi:Rieske 2Fe-2S domain-containing protein [Spirosoma sp. BT704]|uniref:Rieske 2Fe-2S domain-containing protein n=2 Tax=Spirosoma validum TaxID=2771355 RepID=A0A927AY39_9BACT|nr:Rieske 2Fe-2S domain-containing protein [Spirosoma validum]